MEKEKTPKKIFLLWGIPLIMITSYGLLSMQGDLRFTIPLLMGVTACSAIAISVALYFVEKEDISWSPFVIIAVAVTVRCFYLLRPPELSDDIYRYLWDGFQILQGNNPYALAPSEIQPLNDMSSDLLKKLNHPELVTIYPPTAQLIFMAGAFLTKSVIGLKMLLFFIDLGSCIVIMKILSRMEMPVSRTVLYAWHPIPVIEIASSGHIDGAGIFFFLLSILFLQSAVQAPKNISFRKEQGFIFFSGFLFGFAALVKLYPFFLAPVFLVMVKGLKRILFSMGLILSIAVLTIPFTPDLYNILNTLGIYLKNWEFSNFAFRTLRDVTSSGDVSRLILAISFLCIVLFFTMSLWKNRVKEYESGCSLNTSGIEQFGNGLASKNMFLRFLKGIYLINFAILLLSPTLYPWYVIGLVCLFPLIAGPAGIIFSWSVFLSYYIVIYYVYLGQWLENSIIPALIWCGPALSVLMTTYLRYHYRHKRHVIVEK
jgi:hypothetical protein